MRSTINDLNARDNPQAPKARAMSNTVDIPKTVQETLRTFRLGGWKATETSALVFKVNKQKLMIEMVEELKGLDIEALIGELPPNSPRFIVLSYEYHPEGKAKSFPLVFINWIPQSAATDLLALQAAASLHFQDKVGACKAMIDVRNPEELTKEVVDDKVSRP